MDNPRHLFWAFSTLALGGPQRRFLTLAAALDADYRHTVFAMDGCYDAMEEMAAHVGWQRAEGDIVKGGLIARENLRAMGGLMAAHQPDLLLTSNWGCIEWLAANRGRAAVPQIHFEDGFGPDERPDRQNPKRVWARRTLFRKRGLRFVAPSALLEGVFRQTWWVNPRRIYLIPNGVDCSRFTAPGNTSGGGPVIGTVAALRREKRIDRLIEAFAAGAPEAATLLIVGDGPERAALETQAASLGARVHFAGAQRDVAPFLAQMNVFAMSSDTEQMPISLVEAMAAGLPVVSTDVGDIAGMVSAGNAPLIRNVSDAAGLAQGMRSLFSTDPALVTLGAANRQKAIDAYGLETMVARYRAVFDAALSDR